MILAMTHIRVKGVDLATTVVRVESVRSVSIKSIKNININILA